MHVDLSCLQKFNVFPSLLYGLRCYIFKVHNSPFNYFFRTEMCTSIFIINSYCKLERNLLNYAQYKNNQQKAQDFINPRHAKNRFGQHLCVGLCIKSSYSVYLLYVLREFSKNSDSWFHWLSSIRKKVQDFYKDISCRTVK